jgi:hypothetical protein
MPHNHIENTAAKTQLMAGCRYTDSSGQTKSTSLNVTWEPHPSNDGSLKGTIKINKGAGIPGQTWLLSLYTIGLQGRLWKVFLDAAPGKFKIIEPDETTERPPKAGSYKIEMTDVIPHDTNPKKFPPNPEKVLFIQFTAGEVKLKVRTKRRRHVAPNGGPSLSDNHETIPPPPDPGGEEGDGDEED